MSQTNDVNGGVWSRAVTSIPLNNKSIDTVSQEGTSTVDTLNALLSAAFGGNNNGASKGGEEEGTPSSRLDVLRRTIFANKDIIFALAESPLVIPIPLALVDGSFAADTVDEDAPAPVLIDVVLGGDGDSEDDKSTHRLPITLLDALKALGIVSMEAKRRLDAGEGEGEEEEEEGDDEGPPVGVWSIATFDTMLGATGEASSDINGTEKRTFSPLRIPYMLISLGTDDKPATVPTLLRVLTMVLKIVNADTQKKGVAGAAENKDENAIVTSHAFHAALTALGRVLYTEYSVSIHSMENMNDDDEDVSNEAPTAHPLEASIIDGWQPLLMATLLMGSALPTTAAPSALSSTSFAGVSSNVSGYAFADMRALSDFIHNFLLFHARFGPSIVSYLGDLSTLVTASGTMLTSVEEEDDSSNVTVSGVAAARFLQLFPLFNSNTKGSSSSSFTPSSRPMPLRVVGLSGASDAHNPSSTTLSTTSTRLVLFTDDTIDEALAHHCPRTLHDESPCEDLWTPSIFSGNGGDDDDEASVSPIAAAAAIKRFARHLLHGLRSDDFINIGASLKSGAYARDTSSARCDYDVFGMAMDNAYDNSMSGNGLNVHSVTNSVGHLVRALLWEGLLPLVAVRGGQDSQLDAADVVDYSTVMPLLGEKKTRSAAGTTPSPSTTAVRSFKQLCHSFTDALSKVPTNANGNSGECCVDGCVKDAPFGGPNLLLRGDLFGQGSSAASSSSQSALIISADDTLYGTCRNAADLLALLTDTPNVTASEMVGEGSEGNAPTFSLQTKHSIPSAVPAVLALLYESLPIAPTFIATFPSPSGAAYSDAKANPPQYIGGEGLSTEGRNIHELVLGAMLKKGNAFTSFIPLWRVNGNDDADGDAPSSAVTPMIFVRTYADVCAAHFTLSTLSNPMYGGADVKEEGGGDRETALFTKVCVPLHLTPQSDRIAAGGRGTTQALPYPLTEASVASHDYAFASWLAHTMMLHTHVQEGHKNIFLEKCLRAPLTFTAASDAPQPELLPMVSGAVVSVGGPIKASAATTTTFLTVVENPFVKSRRVRLAHLHCIRQLLEGEGGALSSSAPLSCSFANQLTAMRGGVDGYAFSLACGGDGANALPAEEEEEACAATNNASAAAAVAPSAVATGPLPLTPLSFLWRPTVVPPQSSSAAATCDFADLFKTVREYDGPVEDLLIGGGGEEASVSTALKNKALAAYNLAASPSDSLSGDVVDVVADVDAQKQKAASLAHGALGGIAGVYAAINNLKVPSRTIVPPTATMAAYLGSKQEAAVAPAFLANFDVLLTDVREVLLPVATASGSSSPSQQREANATAPLFTVPLPTASTADAQYNRHLLAKLSYLLNHPSVVAYLLTSPETHADRFHELFNCNGFEGADEKKLVGGDDVASAEKTKRKKKFDDSDDDADDEDSGDKASASGSNKNKKYKLRIEMLYDLVLSPVTLFERRLAAGEEGTSTPSTNAAYLTAAKNSDLRREGGFSLSPWLVFWYKFFLALATNAERRMVAADKHNTEVILSTAAAETGQAGNATLANASAVSANAVKVPIVGVPPDILSALVEIVEELQTLCPSLVLTTQEGLAKRLAQEGGGKSAVEGGGPSLSSAADSAVPAVVPLEDLFALAQKGFGKVADKHSNDVKLKFYSLFKQATVGDTNISKPWAVDMTGRAKYDAWMKLKGMSKEEAMRGYVAEWERIKHANSRR